MRSIIIIITIMLFVLSSNNAQAQTSVTKDFLKSKTWVINEHFKATIRFTDTEIISYIENDIISSEKYHLSDKKCNEDSFDPAKVGLIVAGNYIFYEKNKCTCRFIEYINPSEFKIEIPRSNSITGDNFMLIVAKP